VGGTGKQRVQTTKGAGSQGRRQAESVCSWSPQARFNSRGRAAWARAPAGVVDLGQKGLTGRKEAQAGG